MKYIYIGKIVNTHGIKGEVRILSNFKYKDKVFIKNMPIYIGNNKYKEIINTYRPHKQFDMITIIGYSNINEILKYKGDKVYIKKEELKLNDNEYLDEELINLDVIMNRKTIGKVKRIENYPKQSLIVIKTKNKEFLIPYVKEIITVNLKEKYIEVENIEGLIDL